VSDDDNNVLKEPAGDDADGGGVTSAEHITPNPIDSNLLGQAHPSVVNQVNATAPSAGGQKRKCPPPALKHKQLKPAVNQVMTQIELPSYRGPRSPLDLVAVEIIFGCLFEAFQHVSQSVGAGTSSGGAAQRAKKMRELPLKSVLVPR
jgi:hypothetical protein